MSEHAHPRSQKWILGLILALSPTAAMAQEGAAWDAKFGAIPRSPIFMGELGYSNIPKLTYSIGVAENFAIGPAFTFDLAYYGTRGGITPGLMFSAPMRISLARQGNMSVGLNLEPGLALRFPNGGDVQFGLLLNAGANIGFKIAPQVVLGGGVDLLLGMIFTPNFAFVIPIFFGPVLEFHATPQVAITFDMKLGPHITAGDGGSFTMFGIRVNAGVAYHF
ncbi:MAG: hypothetical protein U1E65_15970 [Myxococcota bacterium]